MNTIEVMRQALEALERGPWTLVQKEQYNKAITNLRSTIEQMEKQEPVAYLSQRTCDSFMVAGYETCDRGGYGSFPVFTHPAPAVPEKVEPVTTAREAFWKVALGNNTKFANLAKAAIAEAESTHPAPAVQDKEQV